MTTLFALALLGLAEASDRDAHVSAELLALGLPSELNPGDKTPGHLPEHLLPTSREGHASRGRGGSRGGSKGSSSSRGGSRGSTSGTRSSPRSSGSRSGSRSSSKPSSPSRPSGNTSSSPRSGKRGTTKPSSSRPASSSPPSGSRSGSTSGTRTSPRRTGTTPSKSVPPRMSGRTTDARTGRPTPVQRTVPGRTMSRPTPRGTTRPTGTLRNSSTSRPSGRPVHRSRDVRYSRPSHRVVRSSRYASYRVPRVYTYRPYYTRWWCHPYYRYSYATVAVVGFGFSVFAWDAGWVPPYRYGWSWVPGYWSWGYWHPGFWSPMARAPIGYVYVNGWWEGDAYVEGYYRSEARNDWEWTDGYYLDDGTYVRGHWSPTTEPPEGYLWEPGFWDGETYIDGFYRPQFRKAFYWVAAWYDSDGIFHSGYWQPEGDQPGSVWIPGWFDGNEWVPGYWEDEQAYYEADLENWAPEEGVDDGWDEGAVYDENGQLYSDIGDGDTPPSARMVQRMTDLEGQAPLAVPVVIPEAKE